MKRSHFAIIFLGILLLLAGIAQAADPVGSFVALRGKATIDRERTLSEAPPKRQYFAERYGIYF